MFYSIQFAGWLFNPCSVKVDGWLFSVIRSCRKNFFAIKERNERVDTTWHWSNWCAQASDDNAHRSYVCIFVKKMAVVFVFLVRSLVGISPIVWHHSHSSRERPAFPSFVEKCPCARPFSVTFAVSWLKNNYFGSPLCLFLSKLNQHFIILLGNMTDILPENIINLE